MPKEALEKKQEIRGQRAAVVAAGLTRLTFAAFALLVASEALLSPTLGHPLLPASPPAVSAAAAVVVRLPLPAPGTAGDQQWRQRQQCQPLALQQPHVARPQKTTEGGPPRIAYRLPSVWSPLLPPQPAAAGGSLAHQHASCRHTPQTLTLHPRS